MDQFKYEDTSNDPASILCNQQANRKIDSIRFKSTIGAHHDDESTLGDTIEIFESTGTLPPTPDDRFDEQANTVADGDDSPPEDTVVNNALAAKHSQQALLTKVPDIRALLGSIVEGTRARVLQLREFGLRVLATGRFLILHTRQVHCKIVLVYPVELLFKKDTVPAEEEQGAEAVLMEMPLARLVFNTLVFVIGYAITLAVLTGILLSMPAEILLASSLVGLMSVVGGILGQLFFRE
jgi:hypothetical protein